MLDAARCTQPPRAARVPAEGIPGHRGESQPWAGARVLGPTLRRLHAEFCLGPGPRGWAETGFFWLLGWESGSHRAALCQESVHVELQVDAGLGHSSC